jgi:single-strand DNA-binding protein
MVRENCRIAFSGYVASQKAAEIAGQYISKGKQVYVEGRLQTRKYDDKEGNARTITEVVITNLRLLGWGSKSSSNNGRTNGVPSRAGDVSGSREMADNEIPF